MPVIRPDGVIEPPAPISGDVARRPQASPPSPSVPPETSLTAVLGDCRREGPWRVARTTRVYSVMGDVVLDLRQAVFDDDLVQIYAYTMMGDVKVIVPPGFEVQLRGFSLLGDLKHKDHSETGTPVERPRTVVITCSGVMGDVKVKTLDVGQVEPKWWKRRKG